MEGQALIQQTPVESISPALVWIKTNWLNIFFGIIGLLGTVYGYLSFRSGSKQKKVYSYLFELAEKNIDKDITENKLENAKQQVKMVSKEIESLQEQIRRDIPKEARRAVLKDRLNSVVGILKQYYDSTLELKKELAALGESPEIPQILMQAIEKERLLDVSSG